MREIKVRVSNNFGNRTVYPVCPVANLLAELAGTKTLTEKSIELIKDLGFTISVETPEL